MFKFLQKKKEENKQEKFKTFIVRVAGVGIDHCFVISDSLFDRHDPHVLLIPYPIKEKPMSKKKHQRFNAVSGKIEKEYEKKGMSEKKAKEVGAATTAKVARNASPKAKKANPKLKNVKGK